MGLPMNTRTMSYALGLVLIIPIGGTLYRSIEIAVTGNWAFAFDPEFVDRLAFLDSDEFGVGGHFQLGAANNAVATFKLFHVRADLDDFTRENCAQDFFAWV